MKKIALTFAPIVLAIVSIQAEAALDYSPLRSIIAHPPYHIKPNTPHAVPSGLIPSQIQHAYGFDKIVNQGEGQIIAIVDAYDNPNAEADLNVFSSTFNLPACTTANGCFKKIYASGQQPPGDTGWGVEISLDVQWAHAVAPKAKIILVEAADDSFESLFQAINVAITNHAAVVSMSWGGGEFSSETQYDSTFNVPGVEFTASTGDGGTGVIYPSISPNVIGVGGTTLHVDSNGNYQSEIAWSGSGGGFSAFETEPSYQSSFPIPNNPQKLRGVPDISMVADPDTGVAVYDSFGGYNWIVVGGTSASAPMFAGLIAVAKSATTNKLTGINATLYTLAKNSYSTLYHDITSGSNGSCGYLCNAQTGYDYVTGIGTPKADALIKALGGSSPPPPPTDPAQQLQSDFRKTRLGIYATCSSTSTLVTCNVPSSTQLVNVSTPDSQLQTMVANSIVTIQKDIIAVNTVAYAQLTCQLLAGSTQILNYTPTTKYAVFTGVCKAAVPLPS